MVGIPHLVCVMAMVTVGSLAMSLERVLLLARELEEKGDAEPEELEKVVVLGLAVLHGQTRPDQTQ